MNIESTSKAEYPGLAKRAEAAAWLARLRGPNRTDEVDRGFKRWLQANAEHARAFELLTERVEVVERLRTRPLPRHWRQSHSSTQSHWLRPLGIAAALVMTALALLWYTRYSGISTNVGEQRTLALKDGTHIYLNTDTRVVVSYDEHRRRIELASGEALFEVAQHPNWPFIVTAGDRQITALGTSFVVRRERNELSVILVEGKVAVAPAPASGETSLPSVLVSGQRLTLAPNRSPMLDRPALDKVTAWRQGQVALDGMSLFQAVREMNRYSAVKLVVELPDAASVRVGGYFRMGDSASFARAVADTYGFRVVERPNEIVLGGLPRSRATAP